jgi:hypothetical protein
MTSTLTATEAATTAHVTVRTVRAWCRTGQLAASKRHGRWVIAPSAVARVVCPASDRPARGECVRRLTGRALRRCEARALARATSREYGTRVIGHQQRALIAAANTGHILVRDYLVGIGCDPEFVGKYESAAGRKIAATYRSNHGTEPDAHGGRVILRGRVWHVARYADIRDLHAGAAAYARTRGLFGLVA